MRPLERTDFKHGVLDVLKVLTTVGEISESAWSERYDWMAKRGDEYYILVVCDGEGKIVGTGTVFVERKLCVSMPTGLIIELVSSMRSWLTDPFSLQYP